MTKEAQRAKTMVVSHLCFKLQWRSNHPKNALLGILKGLIHRAHMYCDERKDLEDELNLLADVFVMNGYPKNWLIKQ